MDHNKLNALFKYISVLEGLSESYSDNYGELIELCLIEINKELGLDIYEN